MGGRFEEVRDRIDRFLLEWGGAEFGPAHVVLADDNLEDYWVDECLAVLEAGPPYPEPWADRPVAEDERAATAAFLKELKAIPEDDRCPDDDDSEWPDDDLV